MLNLWYATSLLIAFWGAGLQRWVDQWLKSLVMHRDCAEDEAVACCAGSPGADSWLCMELSACPVQPGSYVKNVTGATEGWGETPHGMPLSLRNVSSWLFWEAADTGESVLSQDSSVPFYRIMQHPHPTLFRAPTLCRSTNLLGGALRALVCSHIFRNLAGSVVLTLPATCH